MTFKSNALMPPTHATIKVQSIGGTIDVPTDRVYFAFADGRLRYDCASCGSKCCRGHGYAVGPSEMKYQLQRRPYVRFFVETPEVADGLPTINNSGPGCFFLGANGLCGIQVENGYEAKPETCRLFPFNNFQLVGDYLVVGPHQRLCPLEVAPLTTMADGSRYTELTAAMQLRGITSPVPHAPGLVSDTAALVALEREIVRLAEISLGNEATFADFVDAQLAITARAFPAGSNDHAYAGIILRHAAAVLAVPESDLRQVDPDLHRTLVGMTPYLRSRIVFGLHGVKRRDDVKDIDVSRVPAVILGVAIVATLAKLAGMETVTFQTVSKLFVNYAPLILVLAHLDIVMELKRGTVIDLPIRGPGSAFQASFIQLARGLLPARQRTAKRSLGEIFSENNTWGGSDRVAFLKLVSSRLHNHLVRAPDSSRAGRGLQGLRSAAQWWALNHLPDPVVEAACARGNRQKGATALTH